MQKKLFDVGMVVEIKTLENGAFDIVTSVSPEGREVIDQVVGLPPTVMNKAIVAVAKHLDMIYTIAQERSFRESLGQAPHRDLGLPDRRLPSNN